MGNKATNLTNAVMLDISSLGCVVWKNPRGFDKERKVTYGTGPNGAADLIGYRRVLITDDMVGKTLAQFMAVEIKAGGDRKKENQADYISTVNSHGGIAGFVACPEDAVMLVKSKF